MNAMINLETARSRIRSVARQVNANSGIGDTRNGLDDPASVHQNRSKTSNIVRYHDNDFRDENMIANRSRGRQIPQPTETHLQPVYTAQVHPAQFIDLDATPLDIEIARTSLEQPAATTENANPSLHSGPSNSNVHTSDLLDGEPSNVEDTQQLLLDPPRMRRMIFLATALPQTFPPFGKTQPNLGGEGLRYGLGRFTQLSGDLGRLLLSMRESDTELFNTVFGSDSAFPEADPDALIAVTTALNTAGVEVSQASNMQPVAGKVLWAPQWITKFKSAAEHSAFQDSQFFVAAHTALLPMLDFAHKLGLKSEMGMTLLTERAIQLGVEAAQAFVISATGPITNDAIRREALQFLLGDPQAATLSDFQIAHNLPDTAGRLDPISHATVVSELRAKADSPVMLPSQTMMFDLLVKASVNSPVPGLISAIRSNTNLSKLELASTAPVME